MKKQRHIHHTPESPSRFICKTPLIAPLMYMYIDINNKHQSSDEVVG
jgi:hypothetical protein